MVDLRNFLSGREEKGRYEHFWSLSIEPGWAAAGIFKIGGDKAQVVVSSPETHWEMDEDLIPALDAALSSVIQSFPEDQEEPQKTVFGVPSSWVAGGQIARDYLEKIKKVCKELSLTPIGFVVIPEAISHFLKSEEGSPLSAVVVGVYKENLEVAVFKLGRLEGSTLVARSVSIVDDLSEGLTRLVVQDSLPSRFVLYDGKEAELEEARQALMGVDWQEFTTLKILHTPKIEIIDTEKKIWAISLAGGAEMAHVTSVEALEARQTGLSQEREIQPESEQESPTPQELGFVIENGANELKQVLKSEEYQKEPLLEKLAEKDEEERVITKVRSGFSLDYLKQKMNSLFRRIELTSRMFWLGGKKTLVSGLTFLVVILGAGLAFWWFYPKAEVVIFVSPQNLSERIDLSVEFAEGASNLSQKILSGELISTNVSGQKTRPTTGIKTVGDKAKGEVTLYRVGSQIKLAAGTVLYGPEKLKFNLDSEVNVASGSASSPGKTQALVTAEEIGAQYNLAGESSFSVGNYSASDIEAKNEKAFGGGTSREVNAVNDADQNNLQEELTSELVGKANDELIRDLGPEKLFIADSLQSVASTRSFSHKVGDEADTISLSLDLEASGVVVNKSELTDLAKEVLKDKIPTGFVLRGEQVGFDFEFLEVDAGVYKFEVKISANLLPEIKTEDIVKKIKGRYPSLAEEFLNREVPGFVRAEIKIKPAFPGRLKTLPRIEKNIEVEVAAER